MKTSEICKLTHIIRRGKYSIRKIFNRKVVLGGDWNEGHLNAAVIKTRQPKEATTLKSNKERALGMKHLFIISLSSPWNIFVQTNRDSTSLKNDRK